MVLKTRMKSEWWNSGTSGTEKHTLFIEKNILKNKKSLYRKMCKCVPLFHHDPQPRINARIFRCNSCSTKFHLVTPLEQMRNMRNKRGTVKTRKTRMNTGSAELWNMRNRKTHLFIEKKYFEK